jgi:hypothetical protein
MNSEEIKEYTIKERIKAYIYFGVDAEMDMIDTSVELERNKESNHSEYDGDYLRKQQEKFDRKISYANKRIGDLETLIGVL